MAGIGSGVVTGAASGIGEGVMERLLADGANVVAVDRDGDALRRLGERYGTDRVALVEADVSLEASAATMVETCVSHFGQIDFLVNSAGISGPYIRLDETPAKDYDDVLGVNLRGTFLAMRAAIAAMREAQRPGAIVNICSLAGLKAVALISPYVASKFGVLGLTKTAAVENAAEGIRVNAICPGLIDTPMVKRNYGDEIDPFGIPMGKNGLPADIANAAAWLISDQASYVTGIFLPVDGGLSAI
ncbi:SDR family NAD(P)-dependent oxidoreductase [Sphingosinicella rhizophila]|uniref:SDR family oxidoreductase n=1 Tax=Sphingosinicella rhizophila TaxID=3050082 RepID=A0ABU3QAV5_9SPHN|nr:SDR family oxidoreductase [Sphingosinicella sp. GR2756]MDT9600534.1 SDR family oxidoreductase [Sphingosinicella sp. GR2756]